MTGILKSKLVMTIAAFVMIAAAIIIPLAGSILHSRPTHAQAPTWTATGNILLPRYSFRATTLPNGKVLIEGGFAPGSYTTDSELFDPATGIWTQTGSLNQGRGEHSATLLQDGRVLVAGGYAGPVLTSSELYDPATGTWTLTTGSMSQPRTRHTATLLPNGKVLVAGGWDGNMVSSAELYDPTTESWSSAGNMAITRADHVAVLLPNGKVLVAAGAPVNGGFTTEAELYDPNTNTWTPTGSMNVARAGFTAVLLPNGKVLAMGGGTPTGPTATSELYDPATGTWTLTGSMQQARLAGLGQQATILADGTVLIAGGDTGGTSEVYDPSNGTWGSLTNMVTPHCGAATALLPDGRALIAGGTDCASTTTVVTELYRSAPTLVSIPNKIYAGYAVSGSPFPNPSQPTSVLYSDVKGSWQVPTATCSKHEDSNASFWVGLGGTHGDLEQIAIVVDCTNGKLSYYAAYEIIINGTPVNGGPQTIKDEKGKDRVVKAGDSINAEVKYLGSGQYQLFMTDTAPSTSWSFTSPVLSGSADAAAHDAADWIVEAPPFCPPNAKNCPPEGLMVSLLTKFSPPVHFQNCTADGNPISSGPTINKFLMTVGGTTTGTPKATPSDLDTNGTGFTVTWESKGIVEPYP